MDNEIQLISDGDGLAVIGNATDVERFLVSEGLSSKDLGLHRLKSVFSTGAEIAQAGSEIAANSGRWVKLTQESAERVKKFGLMESKTPGVRHAMVGKPGSIKSWLQIEKGAGSFLTNPALLSGAAGIMAQLAMQQTMDEITDYLATIDEKVDDVLRAQKDAVLADVIGVDLVIEEAMTIREQVAGSPRSRGRRCRPRRRRSRELRPTRCVNSTHSRRRWRARPRSVTSPRRPRKQNPRLRSGSLFWLVASNCRTGSPCSNSTECWTRLRRSWTGIARDFGLPDRTGWISSRGALSVWWPG